MAEKKTSQQVGDMHAAQAGGPQTDSDLIAVPGRIPRQAAAAECVFVLVVLVIAILIYFLMEPTPDTHFFLERDPRYSYPHVHPEAVSNTLLALLSFVFPIFGIVIFLLLLPLVSPNHPWCEGEGCCVLHTKFIRPLLSFCLAAFLTQVFTEYIKDFCSNPRPNFFAACNYAGYNDALKSGNFTLYEANTALFAQGSIHKCMNPDAINESFKNFVSGHSSASFAAMLWLGFFIQHGLHVATLIGKPPGPVWLPLLGRFIAFGLFFEACWIAVSRVVNYYHSPAAIVGGACIGAFCALSSYIAFYGSNALLLHQLGAEPRSHESLAPNETQNLKFGPDEYFSYTPTFWVVGWQQEFPVIPADQVFLDSQNPTFFDRLSL
eukprot:g27062.t1